MGFLVWCMVTISQSRTLCRAHTRKGGRERERERGERTRGCGQLLYLIEHVKCYDWVTCHATADQ